MGKRFRRIWDITTSVLVGIVVLLAVVLVGVRLVGLQVFTVLSGSMEPAYQTGSLLYVKPVDCMDLKVGDVITFALDEHTAATHRIVEVVADGEDPAVLRYRTKGDANDAADASLVHCRNVIGMPVFAIPKLGYLASYVQNPPGMYVFISAGAALLFLAVLPDIFGSGRKKKISDSEERPDEGRRGEDSGSN